MFADHGFKEGLETGQRRFPRAQPSHMSPGQLRPACGFIALIQSVSKRLRQRRAIVWRNQPTASAFIENFSGTMRAIRGHQPLGPSSQCLDKHPWKAFVV